MDNELVAILAAWYLLILRSMHNVAIAWLGIKPTPLDTGSIRRAQLMAERRAAMIDETTRKMIDQRIAAGVALGLTHREILFGTPDFNGITHLFDTTWQHRPRTIANSEAQHAGLTAVVDRFRQLTPIRGWYARDGDFDPQCALRNGRVYPPNDPPQLLHPNCRLMVTPII